MSCRCWNPARPMPTKERGLHENACPVTTAQEAATRRENATARRLLDDAMRKFDHR